jgi:hypothetical protein
MSRLSLIIGDWSNDGHGKTDTVLVTMNVSRAELLKAHEKGLKQVPAFKGSCENYEESYISLGLAHQLVKAGLDPEDFLTDPCCRWDESTKSLIECSWDHPENEELLFIDSEGYAKLYMEICKLGDPLIAYSFNNNKSDEICIGGYGVT